ncbi:MAG TPA: cation-transporting P-type ATPase [Candidatus Aenigmarchaeota archaeon]|nr:cation-transporting P-type ATPase [Candidatus Aenigmarchaeota archaeon]HEX33041.1 cation-transporting P-type ATPase [Candidatus Aenigmarchaeota archaeon]
MIHTTDIVHLFMQSVSLGVAAIPEGLPAVVTLTLAFGTRRMLSRKVLVKRLPSVETLGSVDVICTDKTGTLTQNKMKVSSIFASGWIRVENDKIVPETTVLSEELIDKIAQCSFYCNESNRIGNKWIGSHVDVALKEFGEKNLRTKCKVVSIEPFDPERKMMSAECEANKKKVLYKKGAPEVIIKQCTKVYYKGRVAYLTDNVKKIYIEAYEKMSSKALYVLALAQDDVLIGLVGMEDPPREGVKEAINSCYNAGINVIMITGDNIRNAEAVADKVGLKYKSSVTGDYVRNITDEELEEVVEKTNIFARITPRDKLRILEALQRKGHIVAMTGDGVNDAPALKKADVGVAMGLRGTEVAKQASDIVLTDDNFVTIKEAIKQGRTIYNNIRKFVNYLLTCNIAEVLVVLITSLMGYLAITPIQILWINLITDGLPAVALGFDPPSADIMSKKPRKKNEPILNKQLRRVISAISIKKTLVLITLFLAFLRFGIKEARTMLLMGFVVYELVRIGVIKYLDKTSYWSNRILVAAVIISLGLQGLILYTPLSRLFSVVPLGLPHLGVLMIVAMFGYWSGILLTKLVTKDTAQA